MTAICTHCGGSGWIECPDCFGVLDDIEVSSCRTCGGQEFIDCPHCNSVDDDWFGDEQEELYPPTREIADESTMEPHQCLKCGWAHDIDEDCVR